MVRLVISYKVKLLLALAALLSVNVITLAVLNYDKYSCFILGEDDLEEPLTTLQTKSTEEKETLNRLSAEFVRSNYLDTKISYDYQIPQYLINSKSTPKTYDHDPRFTLGVYLNHITSKLHSGNVEPMPFSWYDFTNLTNLNSFIELPSKKKYTCYDLCTKEFTEEKQAQMDLKFSQTGMRSLKKRSPDTIFGLDPEKLKAQSDSYVLPNCEIYCQNDTTSNQPGFKITQNLSRGRAIIKSLHSSSYLYGVAPNPLDLVVVTENGNLQVPIKPNEALDDKQQLNMMNSGLFKEFVSKYSDKINLVSILEDLKSTKSIKKDDNHIDFQSYRVELEHERFLLDGPQYLKTLKASKEQTFKDSQFIKSMQRSLELNEKELPKHFSEAKLLKENIMGYHYDWRFFKGKKLDLNEKHAILSRMLKTWFELTSNEGMASWVAHGGLLAYTFNGINFPWDDDSDVQLPLADFVEFSRKFNQSVVLENPEDGYSAYLIDVGSSITHRVKGNGANNIDARMIDINSGVFIDITALAVSGTNLPSRYEDDFNALEDKVLRYKDPNHADDEDILKEQVDQLVADRRLGNTEELVDRLKAKLPAELNLGSRLGLSWNKDKASRYDINYKLQTYNCRNNHFYQLKDLSPLRFTYFEKAPVLIPNDFSKIVKEEYKPQGILSTIFFDYTFVPQLRLWITTKMLKKVSNGDAKSKDENLLEQNDMLTLLREGYVLEHYAKTWDSTLLNEKERMIMRDDTIENKDELLADLLLNRKFKPIMRDPFMQELEAKSQRTSIKMHDLRKAAYERLSNQLKLEYDHRVDYGSLGIVPKEMKSNFNEISTDLKKLLQIYSQLKSGDDSEKKVEDFMKSIGTPPKRLGEDANKDPITGVPLEGLKQKLEPDVASIPDKTS